MNETLHSKKLTIDGEYAYEIAQSSIMQKVLDSIDAASKINSMVYPLEIESQEYMHMRNTNILYEALYFMVNFFISKRGIDPKMLRDLFRQAYPSCIEEFEILLDMRLKGEVNRDALVRAIAQYRQRNQAEKYQKA